MSGRALKDNSVDPGRLLRDELARRTQRNPKYSLRAFAQSLGVSSSFLSKLMNGQRPFTERTLGLLSQHLSLSPVEISKLKDQLGERQSWHLEFDSLDLDRFQLISDWYHFAILELSSVRGIVLSPKSISACLGITIHEAKAALERLKRLGLIDQDNELNPAPVRNFSTVGPSFTTAATRNQQRQILEMAIQALENVPFEERDQSSVTLAIPKSRITEAKKKIAAFRREMTEHLQRPGERDSVYHLSVSFYPVTTSQSEKHKNQRNH